MPKLFKNDWSVYAINCPYPLRAVASFGLEQPFRTQLEMEVVFQKFRSLFSITYGLFL